MIGTAQKRSLLEALLGAPEATGLFRAAILQSDPMVSHVATVRCDDVDRQTYGFASPSTTKLLQDAYYALSPLATCESLACLQKVPLTELLDAQDQLLGFAPGSFQSVPMAEGGYSA